MTFDARVGGRTVTMEIAGDQLVTALTRAFSLASDTRAPDALRVHAWDGAASGIDPPPLGDALVWHKGRPGSEVPVGGARALVQPFERTITVLDPPKALHWVADAQALPYWERAAPLLHLIHWWLGDSGLQVVHAGAVGSEGAGVLLAGPGGSGKSTSVLAAWAAGMDYVGDDYVVLDAGPPLRAANLYRTAKLVREAEGALSDALPPVDNPDRAAADKAVYTLGERVVDGVELRAVVVPVVVGGGVPALRPISAGAALRALAPSTVVQLPGAGSRAMAAMRSACTRLPCYRLELGGPPEHVPGLLAGLIGC